MTIPVQPRVDDNHEARAPYNFIPLPEKVITFSIHELPDQGIYDPKLHTGYIDCELTTASPVYVRSGLKPEDMKAGKETKDLSSFFYLDDENQPVIPGSSLRGMLRTLMEIVTFSKIGAVSNKPLTHRSVGGSTNQDALYRDMFMHLDNFERPAEDAKYYTPLIRGGYIAKIGSHDWAIQPAKEIDGTTYAHISIQEEKFRDLKRVKNCKNAYEIFIHTGPYQYQDVRGGFLKIKFARVIDSDSMPQSGLRPAVLARSGRLNGKRSEAVIYQRDVMASLLPLTDELVDLYLDQITPDQQALLGPHGVLNDGQPVFYLEKNGKVIFFGHARMFKVPYPNTPYDYVPEYLRSDETSRGSETVDMTEAVFGYAREAEAAQVQIQRAYAGRVSISDARLINGQSDIWLTETPLNAKILSTPKPTAIGHYLVQPEPNLYPSGYTRDGQTKYETHLRDYASPTPDETVIRGHKFYWHKGAVSANNIQENIATIRNATQHVRIHPLRPGVQFKFRVRFENLSDVELGALLWIFNVAADANIRLKIGMGKSLGMGAIQIRSRLFRSEMAERYARLMDSESWAGMPSENIQLTARVVKEFVESMSNKLDTEFMKHQRIRALLTMLQWPGPDPERTSYMEIERIDPKVKRRRYNEYKGRPVLPTPFGVWSKYKK